MLLTVGRVNIGKSEIEKIQGHPGILAAAVVHLNSRSSILMPNGCLVTVILLKFSRSHAQSTTASLAPTPYDNSPFLKRVSSSVFPGNRRSVRVFLVIFNKPFPSFLGNGLLNELLWLLIWKRSTCHSDSDCCLGIPILLFGSRCS